METFHFIIQSEDPKDVKIIPYSDLPPNLKGGPQSMWAMYYSIVSRDGRRILTFNQSEDKAIKWVDINTTETELIYAINGKDKAQLMMDIFKTKGLQNDEGYG